MPRMIFAGAAIALGLTLTAPAMAQHVTQATMLDRLQIEELITDYYYNLGKGSSDFAKYYVPGAELDVNGRVAHGAAAIEQLYKDLAASNRDGPTNRGTFHMLLSNPVVNVTGTTAVARFIWTGILNDDIKKPPHFVEQGREYDVLVKRAGAWRIRKRVIIADSGMPDFFDKTYTPRKNYDPLKD